MAPWLRGHHGEFDAFVLHGLWQYHTYGAWRVLHPAGRPYFLFPHGMLDPWFRRAYPLRHLKKSLYWPWAEGRVARNAERVLFTSEEERRTARRTFFPYSAREEIVPLGIAPPAPPASPTVTAADREAFLARFPQARNRRLFLFLGRLHSKKGCDLLIEAFTRVHARSSNVVLMMAGPTTPWAEELKKRAAASAPAFPILWPGMLEGAIKWAALESAELFLLPSHQENFGIAVVEALAVGTPVAISDRVQIWREIEADCAGLICGDTASSLEAALRKWEQLPPSEKEAMRSHARAAFAQRYRIDQSARRLREVLAPAAGGSA